MVRTNQYLLLLITCFTILLVGCKKDKVYNVPLSIQPYIDEFIAEAAIRGVELNIDNLVVLFEENLEVGGVEAAGLCQSGGKKTPTIKIDTTSVNWQTNLSSREQLIFHELGHCVLGRGHISDRLPNGNYKTTMRPTGEQLYGPVYSNFKRDYYFDELFDIDTPEPEWSIGVPSYNAVALASKTLIYEELFDDASGGWSVGQSASSLRTIEDGVYKLKVLSEGGYYVDNTLAIDPNKDFEFEYMIQLDESAFSGILWGGEERPNLTPSFKLMYIGNDVVSIGSIVYGSESTYEAQLNLSPQLNKLTIRKLGSDLIFYLNEELIDNMEINELLGDNIGIAFGGAVGTEIQVHHIKFYDIN